MKRILRPIARAMNLYRYNVTTPDGRTFAIVASSAERAREKAWYRLYSPSMPFLHYGPRNLIVRKFERVNGPALLNLCDRCDDVPGDCHPDCPHAPITP